MPLSDEEMSTMAYQTLISVDQLLELLKQQPNRVLLLDCSHDLFDAQAGRRAYDAAHLPGAYFISMNQDVGGRTTGQNGRHPLPTRDDVVTLMRRLGAHDDTQIVVYDSSQGTHASRAWWTVRWLGHPSVAVLDGGIQAWQAAGQPIIQAVPVHSAAGTFTDRGASMPVVSFEGVLKNLTTNTHLVVDARSEDRFRGENETLDPVGGHIPGAINRFYRHNLNANGTFKSPDVLRQEMQAQIGERRAEDLIMQCGSGVSACHNLLALELAGLGISPLYIGSWSEWCSRPEAPIATGQAS
jgi:thiosulfate/3-mercaptopyruvate sulfurtransferase